MTLTAPEPIDESHIVNDFDSGVPVLDDWLMRRARANQASGASRAYVICEDRRVVGYYALAAGAVEISNATGRLRRNMPDPVPIAVLGRLAIHRGFQGNGLGRALVRDAGQRVLQAADIIGIRGILVHVLSPEAEAFYHALGLEASALQPMTLMATLADLRAALI
ncbi:MULTISPECIES: GNAT family N-acetyltransferase [Methylosinus]|uniref:N-acetyltransferase n=1 Tax=Methylosinus trichosporium (strain ATCC 35070 / NCIMB 11131 / UNIQEM 75 / OB3b) TaxID=595536 RepID=A0A2D2CW14_METT3|nr:MULTISPECIES: GNAT family N-acetyltransferase [Methylosinus]ATQ66829.1 N-acetyltransferase [Methylosinus trichosporium OB3b]OBS54298.1 GNAT family acetyltransferase [Methylosinus sp. 3S-1]